MGGAAEAGRRCSCLCGAEQRDRTLPTAETVRPAWCIERAPDSPPADPVQVSPAHYYSRACRPLPSQAASSSTARRLGWCPSPQTGWWTQCRWGGGRRKTSTSRDRPPASRQRRGRRQARLQQRYRPRWSRRSCWQAGVERRRRRRCAPRRLRALRCPQGCLQQSGRSWCCRHRPRSSSSSMGWVAGVSRCVSACGRRRRPLVLLPPQLPWQRRRRRRRGSWRAAGRRSTRSSPSSRQAPATTRMRRRAATAGAAPQRRPTVT